MTTPGETTAVPLTVDGTPLTIEVGAVRLSVGVALTTVTVVVPLKAELPTVAVAVMVKDDPVDGVKMLDVNPEIERFMESLNVFPISSRVTLRPPVDVNAT